MKSLLFIPLLRFRKDILVMASSSNIIAFKNFPKKDILINGLYILNKPLSSLFLYKSFPKIFNLEPYDLSLNQFSDLIAKIPTEEILKFSYHSLAGEQLVIKKELSFMKEIYNSFKQEFPYINKYLVEYRSKNFLNYLLNKEEQTIRAIVPPFILFSIIELSRKYNINAKIGHLTEIVL